MASAREAAEYLIWRATQDGTLITHLKLQKLCYYAQGYSLALVDEIMFDNPIEAWEHGPVVRTLWDEYKRYRREPIPSVDEQPEIEPWRVKILALVYQRYGWMTAWDLRNRTHDEFPWQEAWLSSDPEPQLAVDSMKQFFRRHLHGARRRPEAMDQSEARRMLESDDELRQLTDLGRQSQREGRARKWN